MKLKPLVWVSSSKKDLSKLPDEVINFMGYALYCAQKGDMHESTKVLKGFGSANVIEIIETDPAGAYRTMYTVEMKDIIFVLHVFQKKSKHGIATPKEDIERVKNRLKQARDIYKEMLKREKKS